MTTKITNDNITSMDAGKLTGTLPAISGANLTGMAAGGAWNIIDTAVISSAVATLTVTGLDTSVYETFVIRISNMVTVNSGVGIRLRFGDSGGIDSGASDYGWHVIHGHTSNTGPNANSNTSASYIDFDQHSGNSSGQNSSVIAYLSASPSTLYPHLLADVSCVDAGTRPNQRRYVAIRNAAMNITQIEIHTSNGNMASGRMTVYGIAHA
jgi:hypothetical protein